MSTMFFYVCQDRPPRQKKTLENHLDPTAVAAGIRHWISIQKKRGTRVPEEESLESEEDYSVCSAVFLAAMRDKRGYSYSHSRNMRMRMKFEMFLQDYKLIHFK